VPKASAAVVETTDAPFALQEIEVEDPRRDEVLVRVVATGMCHTDLAAQSGNIPFPLAGVLGHEGAGVVEAVGDGVTYVRPGDHVVMSFTFDGECRQCRTGHPVYCDSWATLNLTGGSRLDGSATLHRDGAPLHGHFFGQSSFSTLALADERSVVKVPDEAPLELLGPLACGIQTGAQSVLNVLRPEPGETLVIFGAGGVGLAALLAAVHLTGACVYVADVNVERLELAKRLGATEVINSREVDPVEAVRDLTGGRGVDHALEASGIPAVLRQAIDGLAPLGTCGIVGAPPPTADASFNVLGAIVKGVRIVGINQGDAIPRESIPGLAELHRQGRFPFDELTRTFRFDEIEQAVAAMRDGSVVKPVLVMPK
jgi:aryl-alcohol dehydrogenase